MGGMKGGREIMTLISDILGVFCVPASHLPQSICILNILTERVKTSSGFPFLAGGASGD